MRRPTAIAAALLVTTAACGGGPGTAADTDDPGGDWVLVEGTHGGEPVPIVDGYDITLSVDDEQWGGTAACNSYGATGTVDGDRLELDELHATEMACEEEGVMDSESAYLAAVAQVDRYRRDGGVLTLVGDGVELTYAEEHEGVGAGAATL
jgi:heat shock protein HslJ